MSSTWTFSRPIRAIKPAVTRAVCGLPDPSHIDYRSDVSCHYPGAWDIHLVPAIEGATRAIRIECVGPLSPHHPVGLRISKRANPLLAYGGTVPVG